jgi:hypothetical protein
MSNAERQTRDFVIQLGKHLGIEDMALDDHLYCGLDVEGGGVIGLQYLAGNEHLMLFAEIGALPPDGEQIYPELLEANLFWDGTNGATFGLEPESRQLILSLQIPLERLDFTAFYRQIEGLVESLVYWRERLLELGESLSHPQSA